MTEVSKTMANKPPQDTSHRTAKTPKRGGHRAAEEPFGDTPSRRPQVQVQLPVYPHGVAPVSPTKPRSPRKRAGAGLGSMPPPSGSMFASAYNQDGGAFQPNVMHTVPENVANIDVGEQQRILREQIESLRAQQESLIATFGDLTGAAHGMKPADGQMYYAAQPPQQPVAAAAGQVFNFTNGISGGPASSTGHRRNNSHNGSFSHSRKNSNVSQFWTTTDGDFYTTTQNNGSLQSMPYGPRRNNSVSSGVQNAAADATSHLAQLTNYRLSTSGHGRSGSMSHGHHMSIGSNYNFNAVQTSSNGQMRKTLFVPYLPQTSIATLVAMSKLVIGTLQVSARNRSDAFVRTEDGVEVYICGSKDRNRALEGDVVALEILDSDTVWSVKVEKEEKKRKKDEGTEDRRRVDKLKDDIEVEGAMLGLPSDTAGVSTKPAVCGHVVGIIDRASGQTFSGKLSLYRPSSVAQKSDTGPKIVWFKPNDKRVPLIAIPVEQAPEGFVAHEEQWSSHIFVASIKRWPITSLHPFGSLVSDVGDVNDLGAQTEALLMESGVDAPISVPLANATDAVVALLSENASEEGEYQHSRREVSAIALAVEEFGYSEKAYTIKTTANGQTEIGVHVVDLAKVFPFNSVLDREIRKRMSVVSLADKVIPMIPQNLIDAVKLKTGVPCDCVSVIVTVDSNGRVTEKWTGRTIVQRPTIVQAGQLDKLCGAAERIEEAGDEFVEVMEAVQLLTKHCVKEWVPATTTMVPAGNGVCDSVPAPSWIRKFEMFDRIAGTVVGVKIGGSHLDHALLCAQAKPDWTRLSERLAERGLEVPAALNPDVIDEYIATLPVGHRLVFENELSKVLGRPEYFLPANRDMAKWTHWRASAKLFTTFTNPISRYADIIVQRQLLGERIDADMLAKTVVAINNHDMLIGRAAEASRHLWTARLIALLGTAEPNDGLTVRQGIVSRLGEGWYDVIVPDFMVEKRVREKSADFALAVPVSRTAVEKTVADGVLSSWPPSRQLDMSRSYKTSLKSKATKRLVVGGTTEVALSVETGRMPSVIHIGGLDF